jgi:hypothetical protein
MHQLFSDGFEKAADLSKKDLRRHADNAELVGFGAAAGQGIGMLGGYVIQRQLGKRLMEQNESLPYGIYEKDVKDLNKTVGDYILKDTANSRFDDEYIDRVLGKSKRSASSISAAEKNLVRKKDLEELADLGESFLKEHKLREGGLKVNIGNQGKLGDYYNPMKHSVNLGTRDAAVTLHEMGHAADFRGSLTKTVARRIPQVAAALAVPTALAAGNVIKEKIPGTIDDKIISFIQDHPVALSVGGYGVATLYPEAKASYLALKHIAEQRGRDAMWTAAKKSLAPAYGTYLAGALPVAGGALVAKMLYDRKMKKKASTEKLPEEFTSAFEKNAAQLKAKDALKYMALGTGLVGVPLGLMTYYQLKNKAAKDLGEVNTEMYRRQLAQGALPGSAQKELVNAQRSIGNWQRENPGITATGLGLGAGALVGALTAYQMEDMD